MATRVGRPRPVRVQKYFDDFSGGLNTLFSPVLLADNESSDLQNVRLREKGTISKRGGTKAITEELSGGVMGAHALYRKDGSKYLLYVIGDTLYKKGENGENIPLKTGLTPGYRMRFCTYRDKAWCTNGADPMFWTDGETCEDVGGNPPKSILIRAYKNHLFAVDTDTPNRLRFSELDDPESWPALNFIDINSDDGDKITAFEESFRGRFIIFKERSVWQLLGDSISNFTLDGPRASYGAVNQEVVQITGDMLMFLSRDGVVAYDGASSLLISEKIDPDIRRINQSEITKAASYFWRNEYGVAVPADGQTENNLVLVWDNLRRAWMRDMGMNPGVYVLWAPEGVDKLCSGHASRGIIVEHDTDEFNDLGQPIDAYWASKVWDFGFDTLKKFKSIRLHLAMQDDDSFVDVEVDVDRTGYELLGTLNATAQVSRWDEAEWDNAVWDQSGAFEAFRIPFSRKATLFRIRLRNNRLDEDMGVYRVAAFFRGRQPTK